MSSRNTLGQVQGTKAMTRKVKSTIVEGRKAILVQINWTTAPVIKTTVRKNFKLSVLAMDTRNWTVIQRGMMNLRAGQVIHYTQSSEHPGFYYITIVGESCTCKAGLYKQPCHHQADAVASEAVRTMKADEQVAKFKEKAIEQASDLREYKAIVREAEEKQALSGRHHQTDAVEQKKARLYAEVESMTPGYISSKQQARQEREVRLAAKKAAIQQANDAAEAEIAALERTFENLVSIA